MEPILEIAALKKYYGKEQNLTRALDGISFQVMPGEFLGIMGSSGSGKSTLLNCIATVIAPTGGAVALHDKCITTLHGKALADYRGKEIGYLFQSFELIDNLTGRENILLPLALHGVSEGESRERLTKLADYLEVTDVLDKFPAQMSGGQKQRIAAARALILGPEIALAIGLPAALLISEVISLVTARLVGLGIVGHQFTLSLSAIGWTAVGFLAIKLLASLILSGKIVREEIGALLTETPEGTKKQRPAAVYAAALVLGTALLAGAYTFAILGYAWSGLRYMAGTIALGVAGTLLLFYGLRVIIDRLARRGDRAGRLRVFNFRQVEETVIHRSGALAICSLLILAALCCFGAGVATARTSRAETHTLDYTFPTDSKSADTVRETLTAHGLDSAFSDLFEMRIGRVRTSTDYQNTVKFPALQRSIDAMPVSDEQQQLQYTLEAVGYPYLIALSSYNRLLTTAGLPELTLADNEAAVYCDSEVSLASRTALINRLIAEGSSITIDGAPFTLCGQVQSVSVVTDRSITMSFALIVPDAVFDHYTQGDYDVYLDGVLAPSITEGKSLMNAIADMNALLDPLGLKYESYLQNLGRELFYIVAASYLTIYLAIIFLVVANTIIGVQFLMGQQKAARRYRTLVRLGAEHDTLCRAAKAQINWYFGLPVGVAAVSSLFGVRALFSGILSGSAQSGMTEMMIAAGAMILLLCVVEWLYMAAVKRSSSRYLLGLMAPEREE